MPLQVTVRLHREQVRFRRSDALTRGFVGGRGAGKSWVGAYDLLRRAVPGGLYMVLSPTYTELEDSSWRTLLNLARKLHYLRKDNKSDLHLWLGNGAEVLGRSADHPDRLRGPNLSGLWIDEGSQVHEDAYTVALGCLREEGRDGWLSSTFTPRGKAHWTYKVFAHPDPGVELFSSPTWANPFLPPSFLLRLRRSYTTTLAAQEVEGLFIDAQGTTFKPEWFTRVIDAAPTRASRVRYWDKAGTAGGGAYTAGVLMAAADDGHWYVEDVVRGQWSALQREQVIKETARRDTAAVAIWLEQEPGSSGKESAEATVRALAGYDVHAETASGPKEVRAQPFAAQCEAGNVVLVRNPARDWIPAYVDELCSFPDGPYKDQADASGGAFNKLAGVPGAFDVGYAQGDDASPFSRAPAGVF